MRTVWVKCKEAAPGWPACPALSIKRACWCLQVLEAAPSRGGWGLTEPHKVPCATRLLTPVRAPRGQHLNAALDMAASLGVWPRCTILGQDVPRSLTLLEGSGCQHKHNPQPCRESCSSGQSASPQAGSREAGRPVHPAGGAPGWQRCPQAVPGALNRHQLPGGQVSVCSRLRGSCPPPRTRHLSHESDLVVSRGADPA